MEDFGYSIRKNDQRFHLLFRLDQTESGLPRFVSNARYLPLLFSFGFQDSNSYRIRCYQVLSDQRVRFINPAKPIQSSARPYLNYPNRFPLHTFDLKRQSFNPKSVKNSLAWAGVFGIKHFDASQREKAKAQLRDLWDTDREFNGEPVTLNHFLKLWHEPLWTDIVNAFRCQNPNCSALGREKQRIVAILEGEPVDDVYFWEENKQNEFVQIVFQQCSACETIHTYSLGG